MSWISNNQKRASYTFFLVFGLVGYVYGEEREEGVGDFCHPFLYLLVFRDIRKLGAFFFCFLI